MPGPARGVADAAAPVRAGGLRAGRRRGVDARPGIDRRPGDRQQAVHRRRHPARARRCCRCWPRAACCGLRGWSRGPAVITQIMALPVAYSLLQADSVAIPAGIVLAAVAVAALVLLVNRRRRPGPSGIRGPRP